MISFQTGLDKQGKDLIKTKTFTSTRLDSTEENLGKFLSYYSRLSGYSHIKTLVTDYYPITIFDLFKFKNTYLIGGEYYDYSNNYTNM